MNQMTQNETTGAFASIWRRIMLVTGLAVVSLLVPFAISANTSSATGLDAEEQAFLGLINNYRAENGLGALSTNDSLTQSSRWMSSDMASKNYWPDDQYCAQFSQHSHCDSGGRDPFSRLGVFGYTSNTWRAENLAAGTETAQAAFDMWKASPGHKANMLAAELRDIGISRAYNEASVFGWYWTTDFGGQAAVSAPEPAQVAAAESEPAPAVAAAEVAQTAAAGPTTIAEPVAADGIEGNSAASPGQATAGDIYAQMHPQWQRLMVTDSGDAFLWNLSLLTGTYLASSAGN